MKMKRPKLRDEYLNMEFFPINIGQFSSNAKP